LQYTGRPLIALGREIVAEAEELVPNDPDRFAHTEIEAVRRASVRLGRKKFPETTLYTTAEPCFLCSYAIRESNIGRLVIGQSTPHVGGATSRYRILLAPDVEVWGPPPKVIWGVLEDDCLALHR
jgi:tRNA(adenine34) deaminase